MAQERKTVLNTQRQMLAILGASGADFLFLWDFQTDRIFWGGEIERRYPLHKDGKNSCTLEEWYNIVYPMDRRALRREMERVRQGAEEHYDQQYRLVDRQGARVWVSCRGECQKDCQGRPVALIGRLSDTLLEYKVDQLTGAFNVSELTQEVERIQQGNVPCFLLIVGVDNLKAINMRFGRDYGNQLLRGLTDILEELVESRSHIYRVDGDCFAVNLHTRDRQEVELLYRRLAERMTEKCTISAGAVAYSDHRNVEAAALYQYAEGALDKAKRMGKNTIAFFSQKDYEEKLSTIELQEELQQSIQNGFDGFSLRYQPQITCQSYELFGAEVLLRYASPVRGNISPTEIIPVLERTGMICQVGLWVLQNALSQCRQWRKMQPDMCVSVNISYVQLSQPDIARQVMDCLEQSGLPGEALTLEVTESMQLQDYSHFNKIFYCWKQAGIRISVDDFGTGYSSLGYLKNLEVDEIKIDRCFVKGIQHSAYNYRLISNMVELAKSSRIRVCCEGVESRSELAVLQELGTDLIQGYLFNPPLEKDAFERAYVRQDAPEYDASRALCKEIQRILGKNTKKKTHCPVINPVEEPLDKILEALDEIVYVSDRVTYELYYLNPAGRRLTGAYDYKGQKCYKVLQDKDDPCEFCTNRYLKKESFYIWEQDNKKLKRHFILKDKLIPWQGKLARLELAVDITEREVLSRAAQEKLDFAESMLACAQVLVEEADMHTAVKQVLAAAASFYQADQGYLFEPAWENRQMWSNTCTWSAPGAAPEQSELPGIPTFIMDHWQQRFDQNASVVASCAEDLPDDGPGERSFLHEHGIRRIIVSPIRKDGQLVAVLGVANPRHCMTDDTLLRTLGLFMAERFSKNQTEQRLSELLDLKYQDVLKDTGIGLWAIRIDTFDEHREMFMDETMRAALGMETAPSPQECYDYWSGRISGDFSGSVDMALEDMMITRQVSQLEYCWNHPVNGEILLHSTGIRVADDDGMICLEGSCQIVSNMESPTVDKFRREIFEFSERKKSILFHTERKLLAGECYREENFPECWINTGIVHPRFAGQFAALFEKNGVPNGEIGQEIFLRKKSGSYECFQMHIRRHTLESDSEQGTLLVTLQPVNRERMLQLENMRIRDFYRVSLSDAIAYAEVDLDTGCFKAADGLWAGYDTDSLLDTQSVLHFMRDRAGSDVLENPEFDKLKEAETWDQILSPGKMVQRFRYQRRVMGEWRWVELVANGFREEFTGSKSALLYLKDIDDQVRREQEQWKAASLDPLTQTYNRNAFEAAVEKYMTDPDTPGKGALVLLDVDDFKGINDRLGHLEGDNVLCRITQALQEVFPDSLIGRLGGDEFMMFIKQADSPQFINHGMDRFFRELESVMNVNITCSAGIVFLERSTFSYQEGIRQADVALYRSKAEGKNHYTYAQL